MSLIFQKFLAFAQNDSLKFNVFAKNDSAYIIIADYKDEPAFYVIEVNTVQKDEVDSLKKKLVPYRYRANVTYESVMKERDNYKQKRDMRIEKLKNTPVPDFDARDTEGVLHRPINYTGRVLILHFWYFWNFSLDYEIPVLNKMLEKYGKEGLEILSFVDVVLGKDEKNMLLKNPVNFPLITNSREFSRKFITVAQSIPYLIVVDKQGKMRYFYVSNELENAKSDLYNNKELSDKSGFENKLLILLNEN